MKPNLSFDTVNALLSYDPLTGEFRWRSTRGSGNRMTLAGDCARFLRDGYWRISIGGIAYKASRIAWLLSHSGWPKGEIDHWNLIATDDRLENLREATRSQNGANRRLPRNNTNGLRGVRQRPWGAWEAQIGVNGECRYIGSFASKEEAIEARDCAAQMAFGDFARPTYAPRMC
jgi:hypothetical protein